MRLPNGFTKFVFFAKINAKFVGGNDILGRLTVLERYGTAPTHHATWKCMCDCGNIKVVGSDALTSGGTKSCGCLNNEVRHYSRIVNYGWSVSKASETPVKRGRLS